MTKCKEVLLFSGGVDSYIAWHYLGKPKTVYFNLKNRYWQNELVAVRTLIPNTIIDNTLDLSDREFKTPNAYIPFRNLLLACQAVKYSDRIVIAGLKDDKVSDKNEKAFKKFSYIMSELEGRKITVTSPFWNITKEEAVHWYLNKELSKDRLMETFSCYTSIFEEGHAANYCGMCPACFRKWVAFSRNGIHDLDFYNEELMEEYLQKALSEEYIASRNLAIIKTIEEREMFP